jgi:hypothetical protein
MRRSVVLCAFVIGAAVSPALAQEGLPPGAFGSLGMYPKRLTCADLPAYSEPHPTHRIPSAHEGDGKLRRAFSQPDTLVIPGGTSVGLQAGQQFFVRRLIPNARRSMPAPKAPGVIHTAGWITITTADDYSALARIDHACDGVLAGDYLEPFTPSPLPSALAAEAGPDFKDLGRLLTGSDGRRSFANGDLIALNRGAQHGLVAGQRLSIFRDPRNYGPLVPVGHAIVLTVGSETATIMADRVRDALYAGDWVGTQVAGTRPWPY